jgi:DNA polymerase-3 subunit delta'
VTDPEPPAAAFPGVRGHQQATAALMRALERGQIHHALVLVGPRGVGKATFARGLACAMLCPQAPGRGCGECPICRRVLLGHHPDVDWLVPDGKAGQISVDAARACHVRQAHAPYEAARHVIVVDPADALGEGAGNALLKTIEEPRPGIHFLLLTTNLQGMLPTILSRSLPIRLGRLGDDDVRAILHKHAADITPERRDTSVLLAEGSAGVAVELAGDPTLARIVDLLRQALIAVGEGPRAIFGGDQGPLWSAWTTATAVVEVESTESDAPQAPTPAVKPARGAAKSKKTSGDGPALQRGAVRRLTELWTLHLREQIRGRPGLPGLPAARGGPSEHVRTIGALQHLDARVERMGNVRLTLEQTLLDLSRARPG